MVVVLAEDGEGDDAVGAEGEGGPLEDLGVLLHHRLQDVLEEGGLLVLRQQQVGLLDVFDAEGAGVAAMRAQVEEVAHIQQVLEKGLEEAILPELLEEPHEFLHPREEGKGDGVEFLPEEEGGDLFLEGVDAREEGEEPVGQRPALPLQTQRQVLLALLGAGQQVEQPAEKILLQKGIVVRTEGVLDVGKLRLCNFELLHDDLHVPHAVRLEDGAHFGEGGFGRGEVLLVFAEELDQFLLVELEFRLGEVGPEGVLGYFGVLEGVPTQVFHLDALPLLSLCAWVS